MSCSSWCSFLWSPPPSGRRRPVWTSSSPVPPPPARTCRPSWSSPSGRTGGPIWGTGRSPRPSSRRRSARLWPAALIFWSSSGATGGPATSSSCRPSMMCGLSGATGSPWRYGRKPRRGGQRRGRGEGGESMGREPEETRMGTFLLISVLIHMAVLLFAPQLSNRAGAQLPSLFSGGVVQVVRVDEPVASQRTTPQRVAPERRPAPAQRQAPQPGPPAEPRPQREPAPPAEAQPEPEPAIQAPVPSTAADTPLTSPQGADPVQEAPKTQAAAAPDPKPATRTAAPAESREPAAPADAGSSPTPAPPSELVPEDPGPPALPPLGEPGSLISVGSSSLGYPKDAENLGLEGAVEVRLELAEAGRVQRILPVQLS